MKNFRNYFETHVEIGDVQTVFLIGENGQGKSNFLEALYYISYGNSFRSKRDEQVLLHGNDAYKIKGIFDDNNIEKKIEITYQKKSKKIYYNDTLIKNRKEMLNNFPCLIFKHSDIFFVSGSPEYQRQYLDQILVLNHRDYTHAFQQYKKSLLLKNAALKKESYEMIYFYNEEIVEHGIKIIKYRKMIVEYINKYLKQMFSYVCGENITLEMLYKTNWNYSTDCSEEHLKRKLLEKINEQFVQEKVYKTSLYGPHRDIINIKMNNHDFKYLASTGQIRIVSLLLRTIQARYYYEQQRKAMVYLFDDVLLEIDAKKQKRFLEYLPYSPQSFFTFLPEETLPSMIEAKEKKFFRIKEGNIIKI